MVQDWNRMNQISECRFKLLHRGNTFSLPACETLSVECFAPHWNLLRPNSQDFLSAKDTVTKLNVHMTNLTWEMLKVFTFVNELVNVSEINVFGGSYWEDIDVDENLKDIVSRCKEWNVGSSVSKERRLIVRVCDLKDDREGLKEIVVRVLEAFFAQVFVVQNATVIVL